MEKYYDIAKIDETGIIILFINTIACYNRNIILILNNNERII